MNVGDILRTAAQREAAPIGAVIETVGRPAQRWTKTGADEWTSSDGLPTRPNAEAGPWYSETTTVGYLVIEWPEALRVGDLIRSIAQREAAPVGTTMRLIRRSGTVSDIVWTKEEGDRWRSSVSGATRLSAATSWSAPITWAHERHGYEVLSVPGRPTVLHTAAEREAAPVGAAIYLQTGSAANTWVKQASGMWFDSSGEREPRPSTAPGHWIPDGDEVGYVVTEWPEAVAPRTIRTAAEREAAPVGAVIRLADHTGRHDTWTKQSDGDWRSGTGSLRAQDSTGWLSDDSDGHYEVLSWPSLPEEAEPVRPVGSWEELQALDSGSIFHLNDTPAVRWRITGGGAVRMNEATSTVVPLDVFEGPARGGLITFEGQREEVNEGTVTEEVAPVAVDPPAVGAGITSLEQFDALPIGTVLSAYGQYEFTKLNPQAYTRSDTGTLLSRENLATTGVNTIVSYPYPMVGETVPGVVEFNALPVGTIVSPSRGQTNWEKLRTGNWRRIGGMRTEGQVPESMSPSTNVVMSIPPGQEVLDEAPEPTMTVAEHERLLRVAAGAAAAEAISNRNEEFLAALRENWDGVNFAEYEINAALRSLGLEDISISEEITVTVTVDGSTTLETDHVEGLFEGNLSASLDSRPTVLWRIDGLNFEVTGSQGSCACGEVDSDMVRDRLDGEEVIYEDFSFSAACRYC